jgi:dCMP deaminase
MNVAQDVARRSRCVPSQVGCVIVSPQNTAAAISYNGPPANWTGARGIAGCDGWCPHAMADDGGRSDYLDCVSSHAEANGLMQADRRVIEGGTLYCTRCPCFMCAKMISNSGVRRVVYPWSEDDLDRPIHMSVTIMEQSGLEVVLWRTSQV